MAGIVRDLLSLICSADVIPGRFEVRRFITEKSPDHMPRLERFSDSKFRSLLAEKFRDTGYVVLISVSKSYQVRLKYDYDLVYFFCEWWTIGRHRRNENVCRRQMAWQQY